MLLRLSIFNIRDDDEVKYSSIFLLMSLLDTNQKYSSSILSHIFVINNSTEAADEDSILVEAG